MLLSRSARILKNAYQLKGHKNVAVNLNRSHYEWSYRSVPPRDTKWVITTEIVAGIGWWWILYSFWHHSDHVFGEFEYPHPDDWTDEELGIPPDE
ncbi:NADH dehydrogenase (ubiquinone) 1 beta subcomplex, 2, 8kDa [Osmia lignaria lignaria]|uniref:NADH dehydrogenase [ubiquinone] 1 beta subcomplex subunit 2, mitochondrial-like n=1 Tax=Osmia bicornis bicornis TaxID=1437191 RepID=UPI0010F9785A|nr:NADH dehydrogenase [ubiquinone] 1 beta subcomplex subunit 2, mitochondrial-like [Osmia bicornis bicornis]XP_034182841.1 NADH dehydrogenase [ubiquinone] 1 beta subcomplex subunit 2, mitochondrial-like [Osmia lignaria]